MASDEYERLKEIAETHECPKHPDKELVVAWGGEQRWVLRCGGGHIADVLQRRNSPLRAYKQGAEGRPTGAEGGIK